MGTCFVIQPFDGGPFDKRLEDVFVPAIKEAGLEPYRVDRDPAVTIPIDQIEDGIKKSEVCLADISTNNPNVWFELGFAIAAGKEVVIVCAHSPDQKFPFDIQHRSIIRYRTESARDFEEMQEKITSRIKAILSKEVAIEKVGQMVSIADVEGLAQHEMVALIAIAENLEKPEGSIAIWSIRHDMERAGYTRIAITLGLKALLDKGMVSLEEAFDQNENQVSLYSLTPKGMGWLMSNQDKLILRRKKEDAPEESVEVPF
jgi:hypothetical protein